MNLNDKYRPSSLDELVGQEEVKKYLSQWLGDENRHHVLLFQGESGTGKTTVARILAKELDLEVVEYNAVTDLGKRDVSEDLLPIIDTASLTGRQRLFIIDEAQDLSPAAKNAFLKPIEDGFRVDYIVFCTMNVSKLSKAFRDRCTEAKFFALFDSEIGFLILEILKKENRKIDELSKDSIISESKGIPRKALKLLDNYINSGVIHTSDEKENNFVFSLWDSKKDKSQIVLEFSELEDKPESIRYILINSFYKTLVNNVKEGNSNGLAIKKSLGALKILTELGECPEGPVGKSSILLAALDIKSL